MRHSARGGSGHGDAANPAAPGDPGPGAQAQRRLRRRPGPPVRRVGRDHPARPAQARRQGPARPGLRRGHPPRRAVERGQLRRAQRAPDGGQGRHREAGRLVRRAGRDRDHRRRHHRAGGGPGAARRVRGPCAHQLGPGRDGAVRPPRDRAAAVWRPGAARRRSLLRRPRRGVLRRVLRRPRVPRLRRGPPGGRAHRLLPGRGGRPPDHHRAHRRLLRAGRLQQARRHRRAPGLPAGPCHRGPHRRRGGARRPRGAHRRGRHAPAGPWHAASFPDRGRLTPVSPAARPPLPGEAPEDVMTVATITDDDAQLDRYGYRQQFVRSLRHFESFAVAFSFISITTGIFTTFAFVLATGGPRGIWTWPIVIVGQTLVALVYGALAARVPLSGYSYQWASRLANVHVGWWLGWMSFAFLSIVTVSVDYGLVQVAFQPLIGEAYTPLSAALETIVVLALQAALIIASTRATTRVNNTAVATEVIGIVGLTVLLIIVAAIRGLGHWSNLGSTGIVSPVGYYSWLGPFMLAMLLGAYTIVGFESASNLAEETFEPHKTVPRAMVRAVVLSGVVGMAFLIALVYAIDNIPAVSHSAAPVALIVQDVLGGFVQKIFLIFVCVSIFACGLVIMVTNGRLIWSMSRDRRLPGYQLWRQVPRATGGPTWATILAAVLGALITLVLRTHTSALVTLFTASTIMPALLYASTVLMYIFTARRHRAIAGHFSLGRWEIPVIAGALIWLAYELIILIGPAVFRDAQYYVLGALGVGLLVYIGQWILEPGAMRVEEGAHGAEALSDTAAPAAGGTPAGQ